jgi:hypothetical protein
MRAALVWQLRRWCIRLACAKRTRLARACEVAGNWIVGRS